MPTSTQKFFLSMLGLLAVAATDVQAQTAAAKSSSKLMTLINKKHESLGQSAMAARGIKATVVRPGQEVSYSWDPAARRWDVIAKRVYTYNAQGLVTQQIDQDSATSAFNGRSLYTYNAQGKELSYTNQYWNNNAWVNSSRSLMTYDSNGKEASYTNQNWDNNAWVNSSRYLSTYDSHGNRTLDESQTWNGSIWVTTDAYQSAYTYNAAGLMTEVINKELENGVYVNTDRTTFTYTNGQWSSITSEKWNNGSWRNDERVLDIVWYDWANEKPLSYRVQDFNGTTFVDSDRYTVTYGANGSTVELREAYNINAWFNYRRYTDIIDSQGNGQQYSVESWTNNAWKVIDGSKYINVYNSGNVLLRQVHQEFDDVTLQYVNNYRYNYSSFQTITLAARNAALEAQSALYPNPASGVVTLEVAGLTKATLASGEVRNALGQLVQIFSVQPQAGKLSTQLDLSGLKSGIYTVRLQTGDGAIVKRVVRN
ncbi:T9SS type A sorting domain-containing protein [Hymenobacter lucidus]|uniref:T9SS type A sorting domain-containing protein n=1 Tax=Hymenobacter lucidus TaxID=2880930 RepID=A0ABS8AU87_9BACT|nr:T9SS type A sorting domain-containing protein [Hymenobacter lucidus]MCB2409558.1 T9SS type A sorting domain-containing protein [Hymenobacter lucidus]